MEKVHFTAEKATMLATLYGRALDSRSADPLLGDPTAEQTLRRIDHDFPSLGVGPREAISVAMRARLIDARVADFLRAHPECTVLHLGCGLDNRAARVDPPPTARWIDVDYPDVIAVRERLYPGGEVIGSSVTDPDWPLRVPADRPTLVVAEGLTMYLPQAEGEALLRRLVDRFPSGEMVFDLFGPAGIRLQKWNRVVRRAGATLRWGVPHPRSLERLGLTLVEAVDVSGYATPDIMPRLPLSTRLQLRVATWIPPLRRMAYLARYRF